LEKYGFSKPALLLAGGVIEELLRIYLLHKHIKRKGQKFVLYIQACEDNHLFKSPINKLCDSVRDFRNLVHLENETSSQTTILKSTAKTAVASIFAIANTF